MKYTENYHLPQWVESDRVLMTDFNQMCADLEEGLTKNAEEAASALGEFSSKTTEAVQKAQSTANQAVSAAENAQNTANKAYSPTQKPYVTGMYSPYVSQTELTITLGFRPSFVIIGSVSFNSYLCILIAAAERRCTQLQFTDTGLAITKTPNVSGQEGYPRLLEPGETYSYIAFR